jgi:hypothetical protein
MAVPTNGLHGDFEAGVAGLIADVVDQAFTLSASLFPKVFNKQKSFSLFYAFVFPNVFEQQGSAQTTAQVTGRPELLPGVHCHTQQTKTGFPAADLSWIDDVVADAKQGMDTILNKREIKN